jgi:hypothetical protein
VWGVRGRLPGGGDNDAARRESESVRRGTWYVVRGV